MKNTISLIEERIQNLLNIIGELDTGNINNMSKLIPTKAKFNNLTEAISYLQKSISENDSQQIKEVYKKLTELAPLLDPEKLKEENLEDKEMYFLIMSNYEELKSFLDGLKYIKKNQKYLELNPVLDGQNKIITMQPLELKTMDLESKVNKMSDNIDDLLKNYNETVSIINKKFALYNELLK